MLHTTYVMQKVYFDAFHAIPSCRTGIFHRSISFAYHQANRKIQDRVSRGGDPGRPAKSALNVWDNLIALPAGAARRGAENRESGANPERCRHCERGAERVPLALRLGRPTQQKAMIREPGDLPVGLSGLRPAKHRSVLQGWTRPLPCPVSVDRDAGHRRPSPPSHGRTPVGSPEGKAKADDD